MAKLYYLSCFRMSEVLIPKETKPSRIEECRSSFLSRIKSLDEKEKMRLDLPNDFIRIFFENSCKISETLWDHMETELGTFNGIEGWLLTHQSSSPFDTWDEVISTESPDGRAINVHIKYSEEGDRVIGVRLKGVGEIED